MHDFEDRIFFLEHVQLCKMVLQIMMNAQKNMKVAAWRSWRARGVQRYPYAIDALRLHERRRWVVFFLILVLRAGTAGAKPTGV